MSKRTIILLLGVALSGCSKNFLDTKADTSQTQQTLNSNYSTLFSYAAAPYTYLRNEFTIIDNNIFAPVTDEAVQTLANATVVDFNTGIWNASYNPDNYYASYYAGIRAANFFIEQSPNYRAILAMNRDTVSATGQVSYTQDTLNMGWYRAEAHVLRAYFYFELSKRYGGVPLVTHTLSLTDNTDIARSSYDTIVQFCVSEINNYKDSLQVNWKTSSFTSNDGRFSLGSALALKARILLFAASPLHNPTGDVTKWQAAASALNDVIVFAQGAGGYALDGNYRNYFLQNNTLTSKETIWAIRYTANNTMESENYPIGTPGGNSGVTPTDDLVSAYEYTGPAITGHPYANRDPRLYYSIVTNDTAWNSRTIDESAGGTDDMSKTNASKTGYYLKKFLNDNMNLVQGGTQVHHWPVFRYGEVLLEYAEAMNEAYGPDNAGAYTLTARQALNMVRARAGVNMPPVTVTDATSFRTAVKHERRIELAFEDYRYWDLLRWNDAASVLALPVHGVTVTKDGSGNFSYSQVEVQARVFDASKMYYYPFPQTEVIKSQGVLVQNPGW
ncbi:RagB/SusD family nutrient uptake outer membrane protein [Dinghuibacter silviterrae]|uniref:Putative outer membrane starch-binding protein n=1 Tax=Dinghuibacter silviterrae TaxID=1539049 RepID=A0A4R8DUJ6_9BACT|nr:RagB/SusD family nutrient uptake outer membrane protein [Dinghuibacter silviterrae]TDX02044.1 putative outer membrane starch-binding protein [Dinghuibacter silviterrae]